MTQSLADPGMSGGGSGSTRTATVQLNADVSGYSNQMGQAAQSTGTLSHGIDGLQAKMTGLNKWAGKKLFQFAASDFAVLTGATADAATFQKQLGTLAATAAVTGTSMSGIKNGIESAFTKFPVSRTAVIGLTEAITNLGVTSVPAIGSLTQTFIKLGAATGEPMTELASGLIQLSRLMGASDATQIGNYANALLTVSKTAGVSASGVLSFAQAIAPISRQAGISEAAVIGISGAFSKAGADGFLAANTFNSMVSDITTATSTGSPDLIKYSNLLGVTTDKFKRMDKTNAMIDILQAITKEGPQSLAVLNSLGVESTRAQAAISGVMQTGDLQGMVASALGAQGDQGNLNKGSKKAMDGLADSMVGIRNQFTQFGTEIGTTFLAPMTLVASVVEKMVKNFNALIKPFAPIVAGLAAVAGATAGVGSIALTAAGAIGAFALVRNIKNSQGVGAFRGGLNSDTPGALRAGGPVDRYTAAPGTPGRYGMMGRTGFQVGTAARGYLGRAGFTGGGASPWREGQTWRNAAIAAPGNILRWFSRTNQQFLDGKMVPREPGPRIPMGARLTNWGESLRGREGMSVAQESARRLAEQAGATANSTARVGMTLGGKVVKAAWRFAGPGVMGALVGGTTGIPGAGRLVNAATGAPTGSVKDEWRNTRAAATEMRTTVGAVTRGMLPLGAGFKATVFASKEVTTAFARLASTTGGAILGQAARGVGFGVGKVVQGVGMVGGAALRSMFSLPGMVAMLGMQKVAAMDSKNQSAGDVDKFLNPIQKYNDMLGTTTSNLANFNQMLQQGAVAGGGTKLDMKEEQTVSQSDVTNAPNKASNKAFGDTMSAYQDKDKPQVLASVLGSMQISDSTQLHAAKEDMLAAGASKAQVQAALDIYFKQGGPNATSGLQLGKNDLYNLGAAAVHSEGRGLNIFGNTSKSVSGGRILGSMITGIDAQRISDEQAVGGGYAQQKALQSYSIGLAPLAKAVTHGRGIGPDSKQLASYKALADTLAKITGGKAGDYRKWLSGHEGDKTDTPEQQQAYIIKAIGATKQGARWIEALKTEGGTLDPKKMDQKLIDMSNTADGSSFNGLLRKAGGLGKFAANDKTVQAAIGINQGNPGAVNASVEKILAEATRLGGGLAGASAKLSEFQGVIGDTSGVLYKQTLQAQQLAVQNQGYRAPFQSRATNFAETINAYKGATAAYNNTPIAKRTEDQNNFRLTQKGNYESALADQQSYLTSMYQTAQSFGIQSRRGAEDEHTQIQRGTDAFHLQMKQSNEDYLLQRNNTQADYDRQLANSAATAAQTIYDPYQRITAKMTASAGTLLQNMKDQNRRIGEQQHQLAQLHNKGLSTGAIQTLNLADPNNAQELNHLASGDLSKSQINQMNAEARKRLKGTTSLTQSPFSLQFTQAQDGFKIQSARTAAEYDKMTKRADAAQALSMDNMAKDYRKTVNRAGQDLTLAMTEVTGQFGAMYDKTMQQIAKSVAKWSPKAAAQMKTDLTSLTAAFPFLMHGDATGFTGAPPPAPAPKLVTKAGTFGVNPQRAVGSYNAGGVFTPFIGPVDSRKLPRIGPPPRHHHKATGSGHGGGGGAKRAFAEGGIATRAQIGLFGEAGPEAIIPLNQQGQAFMAEMIAKAMGTAMTMAGGRTPATQTVMTDASTTFSGAVTVVSSDTAAFERDMKAKARLKKLSSPSRH